MRPASMSLSFDRPEVLRPPTERPRCCTQQTMTVPPEVRRRHRRTLTDLVDAAPA